MRSFATPLLSKTLVTASHISLWPTITAHALLASKSVPPYIHTFKFMHHCNSSRRLVCKNNIQCHSFQGYSTVEGLVFRLCSVYWADIVTASYLREYILHIALVVITVYMYNINTSCFPGIIQIAVCCCSSVSGAIV